MLMVTTTVYSHYFHEEFYSVAVPRVTVSVYPLCVVGDMLCVVVYSLLVDTGDPSGWYIGLLVALWLRCLVALQARLLVPATCYPPSLPPSGENATWSC